MVTFNLLNCKIGKHGFVHMTAFLNEQFFLKVKRAVSGITTPDFFIK